MDLNHIHPLPYLYQHPYLKQYQPQILSPLFVNSLSSINSAFFSTVEHIILTRSHNLTKAKPSLPSSYPFSIFLQLRVWNAIRLELSRVSWRMSNHYVFMCATLLLYPEHDVFCSYLLPLVLTLLPSLHPQLTLNLKRKVHDIDPKFRSEHILNSFLLYTLTIHGYLC